MSPLFALLALCGLVPAGGLRSAARWKLVAAHRDPWERYDLRADRAEQHDLAARRPDRARAMERAWQEQTEYFADPDRSP